MNDPSLPPAGGAPRATGLSTLAHVLSPEERAIAERYANLAGSLAQEAIERYQIDPASLLAGEARSRASLAVVDCARTHDPERGFVRFENYLRFYFGHRVKDVIASELRKPDKFLKEPPLPGERAFQQTGERRAREEARAIDPEPEFEKVEAFEHRIRNAPPHVKEMARLRFLEGLTVREAAERMGISPQSVYNLFAKLRVILMAEEPVDFAEGLLKPERFRAEGES